MGKTVIYAYRVAWDDGKAPCAQDGILTLACCKHALRKRIAKHFNPDDESYLLGLCAKEGKLHNILYYARIDRVIPARMYYTSLSEGRRDGLYGDSLTRNDRFRCIHWEKESHTSDVGDPEGQFVIWSRNYTYYGKDAPEVDRNLIEENGDFFLERQGERRSENRALHEALMEHIDGKFQPMDMAESHIPYPQALGCSAATYAKTLADARGYKRCCDHRKRIEREIARLCAHCGECVNREAAP